MNEQHRKRLALAGVLAALALLVTLAAASAAALAPDAIVTVCPPPGAGCDYTAIQDAIDNANPGDTIRIAGGTYTENLTITLPITLEGGYSGPPDWTRSLTLYETIVHAAGETDWGDWDGAEVRDPAVLHDGGTYKMWYIGKGFEYVGRIGYATSPDGLTWTRHGPDPVLEPGTQGEWDWRDLASPFVLQVGANDYRMWYAGLGDDWTWRIGYATSSDGVTWTKHPDNPVLDIGAEVWNNRMVQGPSALFEGGTYKMWLQTAGDDGSGWTPYIAYATSLDGVSWTWDAANPLLSRDDTHYWESGWIWHPHVLPTAGGYEMWYSAQPPDLSQRSTGYATATDEVTWTKLNGGIAPVLTPTGGEWDESGTIDAHAISASGTYTLYYANLHAIGQATSTDGTSWTKSISNPVFMPGAPVEWGGPVVRFEGASSGSVLDGLTLTGGQGEMGGGVRADDQAITLRHCLVRDNYAYGGPSSMGAGGVVDFQGELTIVDSQIVNNEANQGASGIRVHQGTLVLSNSLVADNHGDIGVHLNGAGQIVNATIANNDGGVLLNTEAGGTLTITNSIIFDNQWSVSAGGNANVLAAYSDVEGGWPGEGNLNTSPGFVDAASGDYHLQAWSPCIDAGTADGAPDHDLEGTPRPQNAGYDMGAYEFVGTPVQPAFTDVAAQVGLNVSSGEVGAAWGDLDGDGWLDLAIGDGSLFTNTLGTGFTDATAASGLDPVGDHAGVAWGDYNNDGNLDLLSSWQKIYRQGNLLGELPNSLPFTKVWDGGAEGSPLAWVDYDLDGDLDAFATGALLRNDGGDAFTDVTGPAGLGPGGPASAWADYDADGDPDLYLTCVSCPNWLFANNGDGTFSDVSIAAGVDDTGSGHGAAWGDYDNDGDLDLFIANNNNEYNVLYKNNGNGTFSDVSAAAGLHNRLGFGTGANWLDYDLDGWLDIFVVHRDDENALYHNNGDGTFSEIGPASGVGDAGDSDGSAVGDYDNDGDPDVYVVSGIWGSGTPNLLYRNNIDPGPGGPHWLKVKLAGVVGNQSGIGAQVRVYAGSQMQIRQVAGSGGYMSQDALQALFGLGAQADPVSVEVTWPSGTVDTLDDVAVDQTLVVVESTANQHDLAVVSVGPSGVLLIGAELDLQASIRNLGSQAAAGLALTCEIAYEGAVVYSESPADLPPTLPAGQWGLATDFPAYTPSQTGTYTLTCRVDLPGDQNPANDVLSDTLGIAEQAPDAWTRDNPNDTGAVPSGFDNWYTSPDVWVRHDPDGGLIHQEPVEGESNTVYVRLRNRGQFAATGTLDVYWIESSLGVRCGDWAPIGTVSFSNLLPGEVRIVSTEWVPIRSGHTCLQTVIDAAGDPFDAGLECAPQWVPYDNNVSWRNVEIYPNPGITANGRDVHLAEVRLVNVYDRPKDVDLVVERRTFPLNGTITISLPEALFDRWLVYGAGWGEGIEVLTATKEIRISGPVSATIGAIPMLAAEAVSVGLQFEGEAGLTFELALRERIDGWTVGGVAYQWVIPDTTPPSVLGTTPADGTVDVVLDAPLVVEFDEEVAPLNFQITLNPDPGGWLLAWNEAGTVVTATHAGLEAATTYTATVTASDGWGNAMAAPLNWSFTTAIEIYQIYLPLVVKNTP